ncbi:MAG: helix-turn-helix domain-containing protein [Roseburia sp.]|nr:helix-turn-helix domain-containing protein [Roseburia sp.]
MRTDEIMNELKKRDGGEFPEELIASEGVDIAEYLKELLEVKAVTVSALAAKLPYDRSYLYQFFNGRRKPTRTLLLQIAILLSLSADEAGRLLRIGQRADLYPKVRADAVVIYALEHGLSPDETDELLTQVGEDTLF